MTSRAEYISRAEHIGKKIQTQLQRKLETRIKNLWIVLIQECKWSIDPSIEEWERRRAAEGIPVTEALTQKAETRLRAAEGKK